MAAKTLHPKAIEQATGSITCGRENGTGFLLVSSGQQFVLTAFHVIQEYTTGAAIHITFWIEGNIIERSLTFVEAWEAKDVALLQLDDPIVTLGGLPLAVHQVRYDAPWETFGYPASKIQSGGRFTGKVARTNAGTHWDIDLECDQFSALGTFNGLSGAPLIVKGFVVGVIGYELAGSLGASSIKLLDGLLDRYNFPCTNLDATHALPDSIGAQAATSLPNDDVLDNIFQVVQGQPTHNCFVVSGTPGSGKTTLSAQMENRDGYAVVDRYFVKVPHEEKIPTSIRATQAFFIDWLESTYTRILLNSPPAASSKPLNEKIEDIHWGIKEWL